MAIDCIFCRIINGELPSFKVYEDDKNLAFLDINPVSPGHTLLIPKIHVAQIEDMKLGDAEALFRILHRIVGGIQNAFEVPATTIGINNGRESGQEIPHVHIHIIPRKQKDRLGIIQNFSMITKKSNPEELNNNARKIREKLWS